MNRDMRFQCGGPVSALPAVSRRVVTVGATNPARESAWMPDAGK
jgi:hypothetical protein